MRTASSHSLLPPQATCQGCWLGWWGWQASASAPTSPSSASSQAPSTSHTQYCAAALCTRADCRSNFSTHTAPRHLTAGRSRRRQQAPAPAAAHLLHQPGVETQLQVDRQAVRLAAVVERRQQPRRRADALGVAHGGGQVELPEVLFEPVSGGHLQGACVGRAGGVGCEVGRRLWVAEMAESSEVWQQRHGPRQGLAGAAHHHGSPF